MKRQLEIHTEIIIQSDKQTVWNILTDTANYKDWNPFIVSMTGKIAVGEKLINVMKNGKGTITFKPTVKTVIEHQYFDWLGHLWMPGIFDGNHYFKIEYAGEGFVKLSHGERFKGILAGIIFKKIGEETKEKFILMNQAIKQLAEK
jgi:hypothetical protein